MSGHDFRNSPTCPFCNKEDTDLIPDTGLTEDQEETNVTCTSCGKEYTVKLNIEYTYDSYEILKEVKP